MASVEERALSTALANAAVALTTTASGRVRRRKADEQHRALIHEGYYIRRALDLWSNIPEIFKAGITEYVRQQGIEIGEGVFALLEPGMKDRYLQVYNTILDRLPWLKASLCDFIKDGSILEFAKLIEDSAQSGRGTDSSHMKIASISYMPLDPESPDTPTIPIDASKAFRGFNHPRTAALLCPREYSNEYQQDPETTVEKIHDREIPASSGEWPSFLYDAKQPWDPDDINKGLLRGHFLLRVYLHIFIAPSAAARNRYNTVSAQTEKRGVKHGNAQIHGIKRVTGRTIAYAAVQGYFQLSTMPAWGIVDQNSPDSSEPFNLRDFYNNITALFEGDNIDEEWVKDTLAWWDLKVFGIETGDTATPSGPIRTDRTRARGRNLDSVSRAAQQRAQKRAATAGASTAPTSVARL